MVRHHDFLETVIVVLTQKNFFSRDCSEFSSKTNLNKESRTEEKISDQQRPRGAAIQQDRA